MGDEGQNGKTWLQAKLKEGISAVQAGFQIVNSKIVLSTPKTRPGPQSTSGTRTAWIQAKLWAGFQAAQACSQRGKAKSVESVQTIALQIWSRYPQISRQIMPNRALQLQIIAFWRSLWQIWWPYSKDVAELLECHQSDIEGNFGLGYLVYTHVGRLECHQVLKTSGDLSSVMRHILGWFVRPREIGYSYFHFSWNEARTKRQLDINFELMMEDLVASAPEQLLALWKLASDVNRYEGREAFKVLYDPKAGDGTGRRLQSCRLRFPSSTSKNLTDVCSHCGRSLPYSNSRDACSHCTCLKECWKLEGQGDFFQGHGVYIRACRQCFPYSLLYCRHCDHVYPHVDKVSSPSSSSDGDYTLHHSEDGTSTVAVRKVQ